MSACQFTVQAHFIFRNPLGIYPINIYLYCVLHYTLSVHIGCTILRCLAWEKISLPSCVAFMLRYIQDVYLSSQSPLRVSELSMTRECQAVMFS